MAPSQANCLVELYEHGDLVAEKDSAKAAALYQVAADQGHEPSMNSLAFMYAEGIGVEKDKVKAESLFRPRSRAERELISQVLLEEEAGPEDYTLPDGEPYRPLRPRGNGTFEVVPYY